MLSCIIPNRNEQFAVKTVKDILQKASDVEVILVCDACWPTEPLPEDKRLIVLHSGAVLGMRKAINSAVAISKGDYLMKSDGHCLFAEGFDEVLKADCDDNWVVIPRRYSLDAENWQIQKRRPIRDYHYLCYPDPNKKHDGGMHGVEWPERTEARKDILIDDTLSFQGSCWFMKRSWFTEFLGGLAEDPIYGKSGWAQEPTEIGNKTWLGGGRVMVNKKTWYAHLHKGRAYGRGYDLDDKGVIEGHNYCAKYWMENRWKERVHDLEWLIERFSPIPTWPENWREL